MAPTVEPSSPIGPVHRAVRLLQLVVAADGPVGVRDLARRSGVSKSTVGRLLGILTELGMVERTDDGSAAPGPGLVTLTAAVPRSPALLRERLRPLTSDLVRRFGENAAVAVDEGDALRYVDSVRVDAAVQVPDPTGGRFDFHLVAPGLIAMAQWDDVRLDAYLDGELVVATDRSVTDPERIRSRLGRIRRDGFAWTDQELDVDVNGVAVPVRSPDGSVVAAAGLYGPAYRLDQAASPDLGRELARFVAERAGALLDA